VPERGTNNLETKLELSFVDNFLLITVSFP
jgi:hypothetical protein